MIGEDAGVKRAQRAELLTLAEGTGRRLRVLPDVEGWPIIPGSRGQVEVIAYPSGARALAVFTRTPGVFRELVALPGVRRLQVGDREFRVLAPWTAEALGLLAGIIRAKVRRPPSQLHPGMLGMRAADPEEISPDPPTGEKSGPRNDERAPGRADGPARPCEAREAA